jgi:hypothetical protein
MYSFRCVLTDCYVVVAEHVDAQDFAPSETKSLNHDAAGLFALMLSFSWQDAIYGHNGGSFELFHDHDRRCADRSCQTHLHFTYVASRITFLSLSTLFSFATDRFQKNDLESPVLSLFSCRQHDSQLRRARPVKCNAPLPTTSSPHHCRANRYRQNPTWSGSKML